MRQVLILIDAFHLHYIDEKTTPFLYEQRKLNRSHDYVVPSGGFCERTEVLFGLKSKDSDFFTAFGLSSPATKRSLFLLYVEKVLEFSANLLANFLKKNAFQIKRHLRMYFSKASLNYFGRIKLRKFNFPLHILPKLILTEDSIDLLNTDKINGKASLIHLIESQGGLVDKTMFTSLSDTQAESDFQKLERLISIMKNTEVQFAPVYLSLIDTVGHKSGPNSSEMKKELIQLDTKLSAVVNTLKEQDPDLRIIILGDHGMSEVGDYVDAQKELNGLSRQLNLTRGVDFEYFLDSTMLRVWFLNESAQQKMQLKLLNTEVFLTKGFFLDESTILKYDLSKRKDLYGDLIWWCNNGVVISPDFFRSEKEVKGMHGYLPKTDDTYGTCIIIGEDSAESSVKIELTDIYEIINEINLKK